MSHDVDRAFGAWSAGLHLHRNLFVVSKGGYTRAGCGFLRRDEVALETGKAGCHARQPREGARARPLLIQGVQVSRADNGYSSSGSLGCELQRDDFAKGKLIIGEATAPEVVPGGRQIVCFGIIMCSVYKFDQRLL